MIALAIQGKMLSSEDFAEKIGTLGVRGTSHIIFVIGGSIGLDEKILSRADELLSFSKMTFPHQADAGDPAGTDLPGVSDIGGRAVSQVSAVFSIWV